MNKHVLAFAVCLAFLALPSLSETSRAAGQDPTSLVEDFIRHWNAHDAPSLGAMFARDGDFIGILGTLWKDPAEIVEVHSKLFAGRYNESLYREDGAPTLSYLAPDIALVRWHWTISRVRDEHDREMEPYQGIFSWVLVRQGQAWKIRAAQNELTH